MASGALDLRSFGDVRPAFSRNGTQSSVTELLQDLVDRGIKTKRWQTKAGQPRGGRPFDRNALYKVLNNRVYIGEMFYDNDWHTGDHEAIVPAELWGKVHALMKSRARRTGVSSTPSPEYAFLLKGLMVGADGRAMTPCLSSSYRGRRYPYYVPQRDISVGAGKSGLPRIAARKIHASVWAYLRACLRDPNPWFDGLPTALTAHPTFDRQLMAQRLRKLEAVIDILFPVHQMRLFRQLVEQVVVGKDSFVVRINPQGFFDLMTELLDEDYLKELQRPQSGPVAE